MTGADTVFLNKGPKSARAHSDRAEGENDEVLTSSGLSNCILTVTHFRSIYGPKYWHKGK